MAAHKGPASLRPRCTRSGSSVAAIPVSQSLGCLYVLWYISQLAFVIFPGDKKELD
jgi:hypothetical protein